MARINVECNIRSKSDLCVNVKYNATLPLGLPHYPTFCIIDGTKVTELVFEFLSNKPSTSN